MKNNQVRLDLNNPVFLESWLKLDKSERNRVTDTLKKLQQLTWEQVYRDQGLKWEKIISIKPPLNVDAIYSIRITQSRRAMTFREGDVMRFLTIETDHDVTYGKKRALHETKHGSILNKNIKIRHSHESGNPF